MNIEIKPVASSSADQTAELIEQNLLSALAKTNIQSRNEEVILKAVDERGSLVGGVTASTSYGWLLVKTLWVAETVRGKGLGKRLMENVEDAGRTLECHSAWLDTSNKEAQQFYIKLGYQEFGKLENRADRKPADHCRWFMKKSL